MEVFETILVHILCGRLPVYFVLFVRLTPRDGFILQIVMLEGQNLCSLTACKFQVSPDLNLEQNRLSNPDNKFRIRDKWILKSVLFQVKIRTHLYFIRYDRVS